MAKYKEHATLPTWVQYDGGPVRGHENEANRWSGAEPPPAIGARVNVWINNIGPAIVLAYFTEHGFLGLHVEGEKVPDWMLRQNGDRRCHVFGQEIGTGPRKEG